MTGQEVRVLLADDQALFRDAVRVALTGEDDIEVVAEARDSVQAITEAERSRPNVALIDVDLPRRGGVQATQVITERSPDCKVILLSGSEDEGVLTDAFMAGASGFLTRDVHLTQLIEATRAVSRGEAVVSPRLLAALLTRLVGRRRERDEALGRVSRLTRRERQVLALLSRGADNVGIADELVISPETARTHIQNVLSKLGVHSRLEAAAFVVRFGVVEDLLEGALPPASSPALSRGMYLSPVAQ